MKKRNYDDIITLPYVKSVKYPHMSMSDRAAQFAPFAALSGHGEAVAETARLVDRKIELGEDAILDITNKLNFLQENLLSNPQITITYFVPDKKKTYGGRYVTQTCSVKNIDNINRTLLLTDENEIVFDNIYDILLE